MSKFRTVFAVLAIACSAPGAVAESLASSVEIRLHARVEAVCSIIETTGFVEADKYRLRILSSCNAATFFLAVEQEGSNIGLESASALGGSTQTSGTTVTIWPSAPGTQEISLLVSGDNIDPSALRVSLSTS